MTTQFYRKLAICATLAISVFGRGQIAAPNKAKPRTGPRALSVLEVEAQGRARMVPVTILYYDKYYDAALYQQNPVPMVLEDGNVYDVLQANVPIGTFITGSAQQARGVWFGLGQWTEKSAEPVSKPGKVEVAGAGDDDRPVLKRHSGSESDAAKGSQTPKDSKPKADDDPDRPTLKKPEPAKETNENPPTVAKRSAAPVDTDLTKDTNETDPDRPVLRKTKAGVNPTDVDTKISFPTGVTQVPAPAKVAPASNAPLFKSYIAISDAQKTDYRPFTYELKPDEKTAYTAKMQKIAGPVLQKWALAHGNVKLPANLSFTDFDLRAYDVDYSNNPELIFTASFSPVSTAKTKPITYYLTLVGRADATGDVNPIFSQITDSTRLDAYSRLELIDAIDADGNGRGSLLFREYTDSGKSFVLYRVDPYNLTKLFEGASGE